MHGPRNSRGRFWTVIALSLLALVPLLFYWNLNRRPPTLGSPLTPRADAFLSEESSRTATLEELIAWNRDLTPLTFVQSARDVFPNGLAMGMVPLLVDWDTSRSVEGDPGWLVHNVLVGGNPVRGEQLLASVWIPFGGVVSIEWNLVVARAGGHDTPGGHGQLRFIFDVDARPYILNTDGTPFGPTARLDDLIISWEAWRPPGTEWDIREGLDPESYALTVRAYEGAERFNADALRSASWDCYPLQLPDVPGAEDDILLTCLIMGDALARRSLERFIGELEPARAEELLAMMPDPDEAERLRRRFSRERVPEDPLVESMEQADLSYHLLRRSCITQALLAIDLGVERTYSMHDLGPRDRVALVPNALPTWIDELPTASHAGVLARIPAAVTWIAQNESVIPGNAYRILDDAGLLQRQDGAVVKYSYRIDTMTPYGSIRENILF